MAVTWRLLKLIGPYWRAAVLANLCLIGTTVCSVVVPGILSKAIDLGILGGDRALLLLSALLIIGIAVVRGGAAYGQSYLSEYISQKMAFDLRNLLYDRIQRLSFAFHDKTRTGQLMSRTTVDVEAIRQFVSMGTVRLVNTFLLLSATLAIMLSVNWRLALISFAFLPVVAFRAVTLSRRLLPIWTAVQEAIGAMGNVLQENLGGMRVVKAFRLEQFEAGKFNLRNQAVTNLSIEANRQAAFNQPFMAFILSLATLTILWYGGREVIEGRLSIGELVIFNSYIIMLAMPVRTLGFLVNMFSRATSAGERVFAILDTESEVKEKPHATRLNDVRGYVRFENVSFSYNQRSRVLDGVDVDAGPGEKIALLGSVGSGKSTLTNLIPRFYDVTAGRITIDGVDVRDVTIESLRRNIGIVLQDVFLFSATIKDNIAYGSVSASDADIFAAAKAAHIHDFVMGLPDGYDTWVGERGVTLSGGQKQRVAIARTLLLNPRILILDDSTSSVDMETEHLIQAALAELMKGRTTFVIAHRLRTIKNVDQILVLEDGRVVERGRHGDLIAGNGIYKRIYDVQLRDEEELAKKTESDGAGSTVASRLVGAQQ
ncbi:MAG: ABC transporter ATP-binding protein [Chloroflexota bacterium]|nr:MAG: ABC transporter ATP-binding protein [Chloroflexota bacterium]